MEIIARNHLQGVRVDGNSILGYVDGEEKYNKLLGDIDSTICCENQKTKQNRKVDFPNCEGGESHKCTVLWIPILRS